MCLKNLLFTLTAFGLMSIITIEGAWATPTLDQSYEVANSSVGIYQDGTYDNNPLVQTFTVGITGKLTSFELRLVRNLVFGIPQNPLTVELRPTVNGQPDLSAPILYSKTFQPTDDLETQDWEVFDTSSNNILVTASDVMAIFLFSNENNPFTAFRAVFGQQNSYLGGEALDGNFNPVGNNLDLNFRTYVQSNSAPVVNAGPNVSINSYQICATTVQGSATDPDGDDLTYRWLEGATELKAVTSVGTGGEAPLDLCNLGLGLGAHTLTLEASDGEETATDTVEVTIGNTPPTAAPTGSGTYQLGDTITLGGQVSDYDGDLLDYAWMNGLTTLFSGTIQAPPIGTPVSLPVYQIPTLSLGLGIHTLTLEVSDGVNAPFSNTILVEVIDTNAPTLAPVANPMILWPPNHKMINVIIQANASDSSGETVTLNATVSSNEPQDGTGDGDIAPDWTNPSINQATGVINFQLRAERSGSGSGREYTIIITATDSAGNTSDSAVVIVVAHDKGK